MLIEKHKIRHKRLQYLSLTKKTRKENQFIVFSDEIFLLTSKKIEAIQIIIN